MTKGTDEVVDTATGAAWNIRRGRLGRPRLCKTVALSPSSGSCVGCRALYPDLPSTPLRSLGHLRDAYAAHLRANDESRAENRAARAACRAALGTACAWRAACGTACRAAWGAACRTKGVPLGDSHHGPIFLAAI